MNKRIAKNMSDPESRAFWLSVEESARDKIREPTTERIPWTHELELPESKPKDSAPKQPRKRR